MNESILRLNEIHVQIMSRFDTYERKFGLTPNQIILGCDTYNFLKSASNEMRLSEQGVEYCGVPIQVDHKDENRISAGYMI